MKLNLDNVRAEIETYLETHGIAVFHGFSGSYDDSCAVWWDTEQHPDYRGFLAVAESAGVRLVTLHAEQFQDDVIDEALERLSHSTLAGSDRTSIERRLREMRRYDGFTCQIELSFDHPPRVYVFDLRTDWFQELSDVLDEIDEATEDEPHLPEPPAYFSKN